MTDDRRLIEDYLPIEAISKEASREKSVRKGHISTLHLWWARRPLVACRAAVYGALVPASQFVPKNGPDNKKKSLGRANAAKFVEALCKYPGNPHYIQQAQEHILEAHAVRLTAELVEGRKTGKMPSWAEEFTFKGDRVTMQDILEGCAPRPRVLDMFAGGGAIPLEALRLGCEAYALDLNPVAHIIELCTLVYPQKYGKPDPNTRGMTGPKDAKGQTTWGGLANEVRYWGEWVLKKVKAEIGNLYPLIPDPEYKGKRPEIQTEMWKSAGQDDVPPGYLVPVAYLWTRTVRCKNPSCGATVPLVRQTWLCKRQGRYVAMKVIAPNGHKRVYFEVFEAPSPKGLGFDPEGLSKRGNATCSFCGSVADNDYIKAEGNTNRMGHQMMAIVCLRPGYRGKIYISAEEAATAAPDNAGISHRIETLTTTTDLTVPAESLPKQGTLGFRIQPYGFKTWGDLFTARQTLFLLTFVAGVRAAYIVGRSGTNNDECQDAAITYTALLLSTASNSNSTICRWIPQNQQMGSTFSRNALPMNWDYCEINPFGGASGDTGEYFHRLLSGIEAANVSRHPAFASRGTATAINIESSKLDAVVTDPPYYDNVPYADISDFFYVWLKRAIAPIYAEHFTGEGAPKKHEAVADATRHGGSKVKARHFYEEMMAQAFREANRVLKPGGQLAVVYAHKTTLGWSTLVDALRTAGFTVTEAWPLDTEKPGRPRDQESAALASSIFLVARKRESNAGVGPYEEEVQPELVKIVRERVNTLWEMGITGADLVIAAVGAGLRAFTRYERVEYTNGEEVPAEKFLTEVEGVVLGAMMTKLFGLTGGSVSAVDPSSRFYVLWRYVYKTAEIDSGEAIVFTYGQHVELDGPKGLSSSRNPLVEKKKGKYRARDFIERGQHEKLGLPTEGGDLAPLVDILHRILWLMENSPRKLGEFLLEARPDRERLRVVAQALAGAALSGKSQQDADRMVSTTPAEQAALGKLLANWRALVPESLFTGQQGR